jgi:anti-sigma-K factor RskA
MTALETSIAAGETALGLPDEAAILEADGRAGSDPVFAAELNAWRRRLMPLSLGVPKVSPPDDMLARIEARIDASEKAKAVSRTLRADEGRWIVLGPGIASKMLWRDAAARRQSVLLSVSAGATLEAHDHDHGEETLFMISGDLAFAGVSLSAGDMHVSAAGSRHAYAVSRTGCLCIVTGGY